MNQKIITLSDTNIHSLQSILLQQQEEILKNGKALLSTIDANKDDLLDEVDMALADIEQGMKTRLGNREGLYFKKVQEALHRIHEGTYGLCIDCGAPIGLKRLEARPTAELCIECKENAEKTENLNAEGRRYKSLGDVVNLKSSS